jgi:hypothetical protein
MCYVNIYVDSEHGSLKNITSERLACVYSLKTRRIACKSLAALPRSWYLILIGQGIAYRRKDGCETH